MVQLPWFDYMVEHVGLLVAYRGQCYRGTLILVKWIGHRNQRKNTNNIDIIIIKLLMHPMKYDDRKALNNNTVVLVKTLKSQVGQILTRGQRHLAKAAQNDRMSVCLSAQNLENYPSETDVTW